MKFRGSRGKVLKGALEDVPRISHASRVHGEALEAHAQRINELTETVEELRSALEALEHAHLRSTRDLATRVSALAAAQKS